MKKSAPPLPLHCVAFLRGINVGGRIVKMNDLKDAFAAIGLQEIRTVGASGNVLFTAPDVDPVQLVKEIEAGLQKSLGHTISVIVRTVGQLRGLIAADPFKGVTVTPETRLYVTFLAAPTKPKSGLNIPYTSPAKNLFILKLTPTEIFSVVDLANGGSTIDAMELIGKEFGKNVTTRNWNTLKKLA